MVEHSLKGVHKLFIEGYEDTNRVDGRQDVLDSAKCAN